MNTTLTNHGAAIPLGPTPPPSKTPVTDAHFKTYPFDSWDYFDHVTLKLMTEMEAELTELREAVGKIHDVLGEDRASDNTELWKYFSSHKAVIEENSRLKDDLDFRRGLYRYLDTRFDAYQQAMVGYMGQSKVNEAIAQYGGLPHDADPEAKYGFASA